MAEYVFTMNGVGKVVPPNKQILKDRLFFFLSYEELERNTGGPTPGFTPDPDALQQVINFTETEHGFDPGMDRAGRLAGKHLGD